LWKVRRNSNGAFIANIKNKKNKEKNSNPKRFKIFFTWESKEVGSVLFQARILLTLKLVPNWTLFSVIISVFPSLSNFHAFGLFLFTVVTHDAFWVLKPQLHSFWGLGLNEFKVISLFCLLVIVEFVLLGWLRRLFSTQNGMGNYCFSFLPTEGS
jgi:hypothetical protein